MIKLLGITILLFTSLLARENPFFPSEGETDLPISTNVTKKIKPFKSATINLPSTARVIEAFSVTYKNLDGSIEQESVKLDNSVDWHHPLVLSHGSTKKEETRNKISNNQTSGTFTKLESFKFITLYASNREFKLMTQDVMIRDFLLTKPHRIVCDFKREIDMRSYAKKITNIRFIKEFRVGNHRGFYRVVLELDGHYRYKKEKIKDGYIFKLL